MRNTETTLIWSVSQQLMVGSLLVFCLKRIQWPMVRQGGYFLGKRGLPISQRSPDHFVLHGIPDIC